MSLPEFHKIIEGEVANFNITKKAFADILTWAERLKEIFHVKKVEEKPGPIEYYELMHLLGNAFTNSILLTSKGYIFHSLAIARLGVEAFFQISVIESNYSKNSKIWQSFNYGKKDSNEQKEVKKAYEKTFIHDRSKHDYSNFIDNESKFELVRRWDMLSSTGSHTVFAQTIYSLHFKVEENQRMVYSGLFDIDKTDKYSIGKYLIWLIDTFFIIAKSSSLIFENHKVHLYRSHEKIQLLCKEWLEFKDKKIKEFGIKRR